MEREYLSAKEIALIMGVSSMTVNNWRYKGLIKGYKLSKKLIRYKITEVKQAIEAVNKQNGNYDSTI